jgi:Fe2+ or Zn2+ uptake regulation protein
VQLLAQERLTSKQREIVKYVSIMVDEISVTRLVKRLVRILDCSETTVWNNIKPLKRIGILSYGNSKYKGIPVMMTEIGEIVCEKLMEERP